MSPHSKTNGTTEIFSDKSFMRKISGTIRMAAMALETKLTFKRVRPSFARFNSGYLILTYPENFSKFGSAHVG